MPHPNSIPVSGGRGWVLQGEALFRVEELPVPQGCCWILKPPEEHVQEGSTSLLSHLCSAKAALPRESESEVLTESTMLGLWIINRRSECSCGVDAEWWGGSEPLY